MNARRLCLWSPLSVLVLVGGAALSDERPAAPRPPEVEVVQPLSREVSDYEDFDGRTEASATVQVKARVGGYVTRVLFKDGAEVRQGEPLVEIDPTPYKADLEKADAALELAEARLRRADAELKRAGAPPDRKAAGKDELDRLAAERDEARARVRLARAERDVASHRLGLTRVVAPIAGRISRRLCGVGGLARADETTLAVIVALKPIVVHFDVPQRTALRVQRMAGKGKPIQAVMGFADEEGFPHKTKVDYVHNRLEGNRGLLRMGASLPNAAGLLVPGLSVRVRLTTSKPYNALLLPRKAVQFDSGSTITILTTNTAAATVPSWVREGVVAIVNQKDEVELRKVWLGQQHGDIIVVESGLGTGDRVVLNGPERLDEHAVVRPKKVAVPAKGK